MGLGFKIEIDIEIDIDIERISGVWMKEFLEVVFDISFIDFIGEVIEDFW